MWHCVAPTLIFITFKYYGGGGETIRKRVLLNILKKARATVTSDVSKGDLYRRRSAFEKRRLVKHSFDHDLWRDQIEFLHNDIIIHRLRRRYRINTLSFACYIDRYYFFFFSPIEVFRSWSWRGRRTFRTNGALSTAGKGEENNTACAFADCVMRVSYALWFPLPLHAILL